MTSTADKDLIRSAAWAALKRAGLLTQNGAILDEIGLDGLAIGASGNVTGLNELVRKAKQRKPDDFFNAMTAPPAEVEARLKALARDEVSRRVNAATDKFLASMKAKYSA